jgi:hypothetical protein
MIEIMIIIVRAGNTIFYRDTKDWQKMTVIRLEAYQQSAKQFV